MQQGSHDKDTLNFDKLEKELHNAVESDKRYWVENDAKFRAIHQKVETYEEFKDIVKASHLKPLEKGDNFQHVTFEQTWNAHALKNQGAEQAKSDPEIKKTVEHIPKNSQEFAQFWRRYYKTTAQQYHFVTSLGASQLLAIFKAEIGFGLLGDILKALEAEFKQEDATIIVDILDKLSATNRFSLTVQFLSSKEKDILLNLYRKLLDEEKQQDEEYKCMLGKVKQNYEIKSVS